MLPAAVPPTAHGRMLTVMVSAAPPPPESVGEVVRNLMFATPAAGAAPRFVPVRMPTPLFNRTRLLAVNCAFLLPLGVTVIAPTPLAADAPSTVIAPLTASTEFAVLLPFTLSVP